MAITQHNPDKTVR